jgi:hypothetical protein
MVTTTSPCTVSEGEADTGQYVYLQSKEAGTCHVELAFDDGAKSSMDVKYVAMWRPLGDDPHGCGQEIVPVHASGKRCVPSACTLALPNPMCAGEEDGDAGE